ncbi:thioredoxin domain-containing protein [Sphingomonas sp.]|uniref:thioredoxin domain-containing protein n=1 Tax=Sphingomonas sp. TaxID=28214 RepID=UPI0017E1F23A|nr:thioredoxin domain-containing protein [Sphingomonas sp.]MBA3511049.1 thioredoxin domain-containing protein [Sphingomonas sp.]
MKRTHLLIAAAAVFASAACNGDKGSDSNRPAAKVEAVAPPQGGDWAQVVTQTPAGGYMMGNPDAAVKLVEYASMTCPHCAEFAETGVKPLVDKYVKSGRASFELRNYVRDGLDMALALIARCGGPQRFFPLTDAMFTSQREFFERAQAAPAEQQQALSQSAQGYAQLAGLQSWAAQRGVPSARQQQCLSNQAEIDKLVQMTTDATNQYPDFPGTPTFTINGKMVEDGGTWAQLEPKLRDALGD